MEDDNEASVALYCHTLMMLDYLKHFIGPGPSIELEQSTPYIKYQNDCYTFVVCRKQENNFQWNI